MNKLRSALGASLRDGLEEESQFILGGRYVVVRRTALHSRPDLGSDEVGCVLPRDTVLLLALQLVPATSVSGDSGAADSEFIQLAYLANTKRPDWVCGWGQIDGPPLSSRALRRRRQRGSWQVGGRYRVTGIPVLRKSVTLESEELGELQSQEEVLIVELGLVLRRVLATPATPREAERPRLRARVRTDAGLLGWITIELPGGTPLLERANLYFESPGSAGLVDGFLPRRKKSEKRVAVSGFEETWEVGGKYRMFARSHVYDTPEYDSRASGIVKKDSLVHVREVVSTVRPIGGTWLRVCVEEGGGTLSEPRWLRPVSSGGELLVDVRDHLEYDKLVNLLRSQCVGALAGGDDAAGFAVEANCHNQFTVIIDRSQVESLGLEVDHKDGRTLRIDDLGDGPVLEWNRAHPDEKVMVGDRIVAVNGTAGHAMALIEALCQRQVLYVLILRPLASPKAPVETSPSPPHSPRPAAIGANSPDLKAEAIPVDSTRESATGSREYTSESDRVPDVNGMQSPSWLWPKLEAEPGPATFVARKRLASGRRLVRRTSLVDAHGGDDWLDATNGGAELADADSVYLSPPREVTAGSSAAFAAMEAPPSPQPKRLCNSPESPEVLDAYSREKAGGSAIRGVATPFHGIDEGPDTRAFGDANHEDELWDLACCRGRAVDSLLLSCGVGGPGSTQMGTLGPLHWLFRGSSAPEPARPPRPTRPSGRPRW